MRGAILDEIFNAMATDDRLFFLTADMGINLLERFQEAYPKRFINVGIAEQNLIGVAAGLCNAGFRPICYTVSNFLIHRAYEQLRNDIALHNLPVVLLGSTTGFDNAPLGPSHHMMDDWGALKALPNWRIVCPSGLANARHWAREALRTNEPLYIRIPKGTGFNDFFANKTHTDTALVSYGPLLSECAKAQSILELERNPVNVESISNLHSKNGAEILSVMLTNYEHIFVVEDHFADSGLWGSIRQLESLRCRLISLAPPKQYEFTVGQTDRYYWKLFGLDADGIVKQVNEIC